MTDKIMRNLMAVGLLGEIICMLLAAFFDFPRWTIMVCVLVALLGLCYDNGTLKMMIRRIRRQRGR